jgi:preprotein translocase subunit SecF
MTKMDPDEREFRFHHRRKIAKTSFNVMSIMMIALIAYALTSDEAARRISTIQWLVGTAAGLWSSLILGYYVAASYEQTREVSNDAK